MRKTLFYFLLSAFAFNAFSQLGPGYLGKRFQAGYGFNFSPALLGSNGAGESIVGRGNVIGGDMAFNSMHEGFFEFAFKNRTSVGFSAKYYKTTYDNRTTAYINNFDPSYNNYYVYDYYPSGYYTIKGMNYTLYFKFFNKRYVAPWGRYFIVGPSLNTYKCSYDPSQMYLTYTSSYTSPPTRRFSDFGLQDQSFMRGDILFGWGRSRIAYNRITIDYGVNFEIIALGFTLWDLIGENPIDIISGNRTTNLNYMEITSRSRVREVNRVNLFLKLGVLLF